MALLADRGASVTVVTATDGEATRGSRVSPDETARRRRAEAERAAAVVGATPRFLGLADGGLVGSDGRAHRCAAGGRRRARA